VQEQVTGLLELGRDERVPYWGIFLVFCCSISPNKSKKQYWAIPIPFYWEVVLRNCWKYHFMVRKQPKECGLAWSRVEACASVQSML